MNKNSSKWLLDTYNPVGCPVYHHVFGIGTVISKLATGYYTVHFSKYELAGGDINYALSDIEELYKNLRRVCGEEE